MKIEPKNDMLLKCSRSPKLSLYMSDSGLYVVDWRGVITIMPFRILSDGLYSEALPDLAIAVFDLMIERKKRERRNIAGLPKR